MTQFVPLKIDTSSKEYGEWTRDYKKEGNTIPILYVVRADGKMIYGKSGSLLGDELPNMLVAALGQSGKILPAQQAELAEKTYQTFYSLREGGDDAGALKALSKIKKLGIPGTIESFANPITKINTEVQAMAEEVRTKLADIMTRLEGSDTERQVDALLEWYKIKSDYGLLKLTKPDFSAFNRSLTKLKELKPLIAEVKIIDSARNSKSKSAKIRGIEKLAGLVESSQFEEVKARAKIESDKLQETTTKD